jgi:hypothetical protein
MLHSLIETNNFSSSGILNFNCTAILKDLPSKEF